MRDSSARPGRTLQQRGSDGGEGAGARRKPWTKRWWPALIFIMGLVHASAFALLVPPWQAPDEPGHVEYACLLGRLGRAPQVADHLPALQAEIIASLARNDFWPAVRETWPAALPAAFAADPFLIKSGQQIGDEPPLYYPIPALLCRLNLPLEARLRLMRLAGAALFGLTGVVAAWVWRGHPSSIVHFVAVVLVLLPMPAFIGGSANNDVLALLSATAVFAAVLRIQRLGLSWQRAVGLAVLLGLALSSKKTNAFLLPWVGILAAAAGWRWLGQRYGGHGLLARPLTRLGLVLTVALVLASALMLPSNAPASWRGRSQPLGRGQVTTAGEPDRMATQVLDRALPKEGRIFQSVTGAVAAAQRGQTVQATILVRSPTGQPRPGRLTVRDAAGYDEKQFIADGQWQRVEISHTVAMTTSYVKLAVTAMRTDPAQAGALLVDDAFLGRPDGDNWLRNAGFERAASWGELLVIAPLENRWQEFAPRVLSAAALAPDALSRYALYTALLLPGFWGNFGWLQRPAPIWVYAILAMLCLAAAAGLITALHRACTPVVPPAILASWLLALILIGAQTLLPMIGRQWQPQGRYLFPALLPITSLLLIGLDSWLQTDQHPRRLIAGLALLLMFDVYCLARASFLL